MCKSEAERSQASRARERDALPLPGPSAELPDRMSLPLPREGLRAPLRRLQVAGEADVSIGERHSGGLDTSSHNAPAQDVVVAVVRADVGLGGRLGARGGNGEGGERGDGEERGAHDEKGSGVLGWAKSGGRGDLGVVEEARVEKKREREEQRL